MHKTLAAQFMTEGRAFRTSVGGQPRAPLCGMGVCYECRATVEGVPHVRTCQVALGDPPPAPRSASADILIAGAGPAGIAAAAAAAESGRKVTLLDDNPAAGGQIWRGQSGGREWFRRLELASFDFLPQTRIVGGEGNQVTVETNEARATVSFNQLILATGARELFLPFPGWTLPNVTGAGGLQAPV
ncbi:MAG TPA: hypothetical protein DEH78_31880, partial [Solibacterales bacterium]|nr:hypothetical protein [Bryobacterales bacterium]